MRKVVKALLAKDILIEFGGLEVSGPNPNQWKRYAYMYLSILYLYKYLCMKGRSGVVAACRGVWTDSHVWYMPRLFIAQVAGLEPAAAGQAPIPQGHPGATLPPAAGESFALYPSYRHIKDS